MTASNNSGSGEFVNLRNTSGHGNAQSMESMNSERPSVDGSGAASILMHALSVKLDRLPLLESMQDRIEAAYSVKIKKDIRASTDGKRPPDVQWISIYGTKSTIRDAHQYIQVLVNPREWTVFEFSPDLSDLFGDDACQQVEKKSEAVLLRDGDSRLIIHGADQLPVIMALSILEDMVSQYQAGVDESLNSIQAATSHSSAMLDDILQRTLSEDADVGDLDADISSMPDEVKRAVLMSYHSQHSQAAAADSEEASPVTGTLPALDIVDISADPELIDISSDDLVVVTQESSNLPVSSSIATTSQSQVISGQTASTSSTSCIFDPSVQPLVKLALSKEYTTDEIECVLGRSSQWKESEFLRTLHTNRRIHSAGRQSMLPAGIVADKLHDSNASVIKLNTTTSPTFDNASSQAMYASSKAVDDLGGRMNVDKSVINLKSDDEGSSSDDSDMDVEIWKANDDIRLQQVSTDKSQSQPDKPARPTADVQQLSAVGGVKPKKKKKKKKKKQPASSSSSSNLVTPQKGSVDAAKTGSNLSDLDYISLYPCNSTTAKTNDVILLDDDKSDSDIEELCVPVLNHKERRRLAALGRQHSPSPDRQKVTAASRGRSPVSPFKNQPAERSRAVLAPVTHSATTSSSESAQSMVTVTSDPDPGSLRYIVIDGSNVAMHHGNGKVFSCRGIRIVIDYFKKRGHSRIVALVPQWRRQQPTFANPATDHAVLETLKTEGTIVFTPSRRIGNRNISCYDDRFMLDLAIQTGGVIVTNDNYRDLYQEKFQYREVIENRLLLYSFVGDIFMIPEDPLGQHGPCLDDFLRVPSSSTAHNRTNSAVQSRGSYHPFGGQQRTAIHEQSYAVGTRPGMVGNVPSNGAPYRPGTQFRQSSLPQRQQFRAPWLQQTRGQRAANQQVQPQQQARYSRPPTALWPPPSAYTTPVYQADGGPQRLATNVPASARQPAPSPQLQNSRDRGHGIRPPQVARSAEKTEALRKQLMDVFPHHRRQVDDILQRFPNHESADDLCLILADEVMM